MANEKRLIRAIDVYSLFDMNGKKTLRVVDIDSIQRVDAVEVVRCKDCKFHETTLCFMDDIYNCSEDDFCSYGERRTDNGR